MRSVGPLSRARRLCFASWKQVLVVCVVVATVWSAAPDVSSGAGATSTVSVTVVSAISLSNQCGQRPAWSIGSVVAGSSALTATGASVCRFTFSSSNASAMLQLYQADRSGNSMVGLPTGWDWKSNGSGTQELSHAGAGMMLEQDEWDVTGAYARSMDGGATWTEFSPGGGTTPHVSVVSGTVGWRAGSGTVRLSTNLSAGTPTWSVVGNAPASIDAIDAIDATTAWTVTSGTARYTANAGATAWSSQSTGACFNAAFIDAVSSTTAFAAGSGSVCRSTDSNGSTWTALTSGGASSAWATDVMASPGTPTTVWFVATAGRVFRSVNNGTLWVEVATIPEAVDLSAIDVMSSTEAVVAGLDGIAYRTVDSGASWTRLALPFTARIEGISAPAGTSTIVVSARGGSELHTANGTAWASRHTRFNNIRDIDSIDDSAFFASDSNGAVLRSTDSGATWSSIPTVATSANFHGVAMADQLNVVAVGDAGSIVTTDDGGATWTARASGTTADLWDVNVDSEGRMIAVGTGGVILRSTDGGRSWTIRSSLGGWLRRIDFKSGTPMVAVGSGGIMRRSSDNGVTWTSPTSGVTGVLDSISVASPTVAYASQYGTLVKSVDGGVTWVTTAIGGMAHVDAVTEDQIWLTTERGAGWAQWANVSLDGGVTYIAPFGNQDPNVSYIHALDNGRIMFGGENGAVRVTKLAPEIPDYAAGGWSGTASFFGVCLQGVGGTATVGAWPADASGTCTASDSDPWRGVPIAPTKVAQTLAAGTGQVDLVWGVFTKNDLAPGQYAASVVVQASAPNV